MIFTRSFRAMGTEVSLIGPEGHQGLDGAFEQVRTTFDREESRCSRFRGDSELSWINAGAGGRTLISSGLAEIVGLALEAARRTSGRFDPTVLHAVVAAGYDRDFDEVLAGARAALHPSAPCGRWDEVDLRGRELRLPPGVGLDLGGIAKGWTVDLAVGAALRAGLPWALVNAGGDLRIAGHLPGGLEVAVQDPEDATAELARLRLLSGALATSSVTRRAWGPDLHHLIDPSTGAPAAGRILQATVWAPTCVEAEVAAKEVLLTDGGELDGTTGIVVSRDGEVRLNLEAA